jgi:hypothetical protein
MDLNQRHSNILVTFLPIPLILDNLPTTTRRLGGWKGCVPPISAGGPIYTPLAPPQLLVHVLTFILWNVKNVGGYEKAGRFRFFNKADVLLMIKGAQII